MENSTQYQGVDILPGQVWVSATAERTIIGIDNRRNYFIRRYNGVSKPIDVVVGPLDLRSILTWDKCYLSRANIKPAGFSVIKVCIREHDIHKNRFLLAPPETSARAVLSSLLTFYQREWMTSRYIYVNKERIPGGYILKDNDVLEVLKYEHR